MGIWIELHCDKPAPIHDGCGRNDCLSGGGNQPGAMTAKRPAETARSLLKQAKKDGWVVADGKLICPKCAAYWKASNAELCGARRASEPTPGSAARRPASTDFE